MLHKPDISHVNDKFLLWALVKRTNHSIFAPSCEIGLYLSGN